MLTCQLFFNPANAGRALQRKQDTGVRKQPDGGSATPLSLLQKLTSLILRGPTRLSAVPHVRRVMLFYQLISHLASYFAMRRKEQRRPRFRVPAQPVFARHTKQARMQRSRRY